MVNSHPEETNKAVSSESLPKEKRPRLIGIDLFRVIAIYAVVILHSDGVVKVLPPFWLKIREFSLFAVPFFLAAAFYFAVNQIYASRSSYPLRSRLTRLLIPYACWSGVYVLYKVARYTIVGEPAKILEIVHDPLNLLFFGGAAIHLYFLSLLALGTLLLKLAEVLINKNVSFKALGWMTLASLLFYEGAIILINILQNEPYYSNTLVRFPVPHLAGFNPFLRLALVIGFWLVKCLPYIALSMFLSHPKHRIFFSKLIDRYSFLWLVIFLDCNIFGSFILSNSVYEIARGYTALLAAIALSKYLQNNSFLQSLGQCTFGIYLIHPLFVEVLQPVAIRLYPDFVHHTSTAALVVASSVVFLLSWIATIKLTENKTLSFFFGYR